MFWCVRMSQFTYAPPAVEGSGCHLLSCPGTWMFLSITNMAAVSTPISVLVWTCLRYLGQGEALLGSTVLAFLLCFVEI